MKLKPAIFYKGKLYVGEQDDHHNNIIARYDLPSDDKYRGFTSDGKVFYSRKKAEAWMSKHEPEAYAKLEETPNGLHSETYADAHDIEQKPDPAHEEPDDTKLDLSDKVAMIYDRGLYLYLAERLAQDFKKVYYHLPQSQPYPTSELYNIATGIKGVERCFDFWGTLDKCDIIIFPDTYDGSLQTFLREKGYRVFGSGHGEKVETDKIFFMETLENVGLPCPKTYLAEGIDDLLQYLEKEGGPKWLKGMTRGDFETKKFVDMDHIRPFIDDLKRKLGKRVEKLDILVQDPIDSEVEAGYDGFNVDGQFSKNCLCGYEVKDKAFVAAVVEEPAPLVNVVNEAFAPIFKELGYRGAYSTEIRITKDGLPYYIDPTTRFGSPPGELMSLLYENYAEVIWQCAEGVLPLPIAKKKYGAQMVLTSNWYREGHEMYIEYPKKYKENMKLSNYYIDGTKTFIVPNDTEEFFGSVVAIGDTIEEAIEQVNEILKSVVCEKFKWDENAFEEAKEVIENGKKFDLEF